MSLRRLCICAALGLSTFTASLSLAQDQTAARVRQPDTVTKALEAYEAAVKGLPLNGDNYATYRKAANDAVTSLPIDALTIEDIEQLIEKMLVGRSTPETQNRIDDRLAEIAKSPDADGARAAMIRTTINLTPTTEDKESWKAHAAEDKRRQMEMMAHPGLAKAVELGQTKYLFANGSINSDLADDAYAQAVMRVAAMPLPADATLRLWYAFTPVVEDKSAVSPEIRERLRHACLDRTVAALVIPPDKYPSQEEHGRMGAKITERMENYQSAYAQGRLLNHAAPDIKFLWTNAPGAPKHLGYIRGKVIVLDFWAIWCGPCVDSFPQMRDLQARYKGYPVVILGVTDLEGAPNPGGVAANGKPIEVTPEARFTLLQEWAKSQDVTWPLAVSATGVFNPEYGIRGIPHVVIIDPQGKVRYRALHPATDPEKKHAYIDGLLQEFKLPHPGS